MMSPYLHDGILVLQFVLAAIYLTEKVIYGSFTDLIRRIEGRCAPIFVEHSVLGNATQELLNELSFASCDEGHAFALI